MQKALRNTSGKPTTVENLDKRDAARNKPSANPVILVQSDKNRNLIDRIDRDYEANRVRQDKIEQRPDPQKGD